MIGYEPTMAERVRYIAYALGGMTTPDTDDPEVPTPTEVLVPSETLVSFDIDLQNVADDLDEWSLKLHDLFRDLSMSFIAIGAFLDYQVSVTKKSGSVRSLDETR